MNSKKTGRGMKKILPVLVCLILLPACLWGCKQEGEGKQDRYALRLSGIERLELGDYGGAVEDFDAAIQAHGGKIGEFEIDVLKYRAEAEYMLGDYQAAAHTYDVLLEIDGEEVEYCYQNAVMKALSGDTEGALSAYAHGIRLEQPGEKKKSLFGKKPEETKKDTDGSRDEGQETPSHKGNFGRAEALSAVAKACQRDGRNEDARKLFDQAVQDGAAGPEVFYYMGVEYLEEEQYTEALDAFERAALAGNKRLSEAGGETGQPEEIRKVIRDSRFNQAVIYEYQGLYQKALNAFEAYVAEFGPDEAAQKEIIFLQTR